MKIIQFLGGLGNQMFQYAFYLGMKQRWPETRADVSQFKSYSLHNGYELDKVFSIEIDQASRYQVDLYCNPNRKFIFRKLRRIAGLKHSVFQEREEFAFDSEAFKNSEARYYIGYWQNERYFSDLREDVRNAFVFKTQVDEVNSVYLKQMQTTNSVAIHVRRGDYVGHSTLGGVCGPEYYTRSIERISRQVDNPTFFLFSNDIEWCRQNIKVKNQTYIEGNTGDKAPIDMHLMSECKHQIIANSSFSWWSAWLNSNPQKIVIAPTRWINNSEIKDGLIPHSWIQL